MSAQPLNLASDSTAESTNDMNLVEIWLRWDPTRLVAGALAGLLGGLVATAFAGVLATAMGEEFWYPIKIAALPIMGSSATAYGVTSAIGMGIASIEVLSLLLGAVFAHFVSTHSLPSLIGMGIVWGLFTWIFWFNLFMQSFKAIYAAQISTGAAFPATIVFGLTLTSVSFFDRALRRSGK